MHRQRLTLEQRRELKRIADSFEDNWKDGIPSVVDRVLWEEKPLRRALLCDLASADVEFRIRRNLPVNLGINYTGPDLSPCPVCLDALRAKVARRDGARFTVEELHARGGLGQIHKGRDRELDRLVAIKAVRPDKLAEPDLRRRFLREAVITGRLEHPGIVPVYALDRNAPDGPKYVMRFVQGGTLAELITTSPDRSHDLPRFLDIFLSVCQTVAYAHSQGVIHRDLKPKNVMVGNFGEVLVVDWGLAKVIDPSRWGGQIPEGLEENAVRVEGMARREYSDPGTQLDSSPLGTYAYMPPEQAKGEANRVDRRADVFGLGAILCEILTGQPPYTGSGEEVRQRAVDADLAETLARLNGCRADPALVALAKQCLEKQPTARPADAGAVADAVAAYLAGLQERARRADLNRAAAEARAQEARKRQLLTLVLAGTVLLAVTGSAAVGLSYQRDRAQRATEEAQRLFADRQAAAESDRQRAAADQAVRMAVDESQAWLDRATKARPERKLQEVCREAEVAAARAVERARGGFASPAVRKRAEEAAVAASAERAAVERDIALLGRLLEVTDARALTDHPHVQVTPTGGRSARTVDKGELGLGQDAGPGHAAEGAGPTAEEQFLGAFQAWGLDVGNVPTTEAAARLSLRPDTVREGVAAALDEWAIERRRKGKDSWRPLTDLASAVDPDTSPERRELRALMADGGLRREAVAAAAQSIAAGLQPMGAFATLASGLGLTRLQLKARGSDAAGGSVLGVVLLARSLQEVGDSQAAERLLRSAAWGRPSEAVLWSTLGRLLERSSPPRWAEAGECYAAARILQPELGVRAAVAMVESGRAQSGAEILEGMVRQSQNDAELRILLGDARRAQRQTGRAEADYRDALRLQPDHPVAHNNLGIALFDQGRYREAEAEYREALHLRPSLTQALNNLGNALERQSRFSEAEAVLRQVIGLRPDDPEPRFNLGIVLRGRSIEEERLALPALAASAVGLVSSPLGEGPLLTATTLTPGRTTQRKRALLEEAEASCRVAVRLSPWHPLAHYNLGDVLSEQGRLLEAEAAYREAIRLRPSYPDPHNQLGLALMGQREFRSSEAAFREALRCRPDYSQAHNNLGNVLRLEGRMQEAEAEYREALRLRPVDYEVYNNLGNVLRDQGRYGEAEAAYRTSISLPPNFAVPYNGLGNVLINQGLLNRRLLQEAESVFLKGIELAPESPEPRNGLGSVRRLLHQIPAAEKALGRALQLRPRYPEALNNLGLCFLERGQVAAAEAKYREALRIRPDFVLALSNLGNVLYRQGRFAEAEAEYREALRINPDSPEALWNLGLLLLDLGRPGEALAKLGRGRELGLPRGLLDPRGSERLVERANWLAALEPRLPAVLRSEANPSGPVEAVGFAEICLRRHPAAAVRFYSAAIAGEPKKLAESLGREYRYNAASAAALAAGEAGGAATAGEESRVALRRQSLAWLRADLSDWRRRAEGDPKRTAEAMVGWQKDPELAGVRDLAALSLLSLGEVTDWVSLWADVAELLRKTSPPAR
jgi:tetratricopeptide (TPR) repeat protein